MAIALVLNAGSAVARPPQPIPCPPDVGAALAEECPCDGKNGQAWKNHGKYVSCVVRYRNLLRKSGCLDDEAKRTIAKCAARSTCGKEGAALCCVYDTSGTCDDAMPGDEVLAGACSNDATASCDTAEDCITATGPTLVRHEARCTDNGGTVVGGGSVCSSCPIPPPTPTATPAP
jgi:hypothetical protein